MMLFSMAVRCSASFLRVILWPFSSKVRSLKAAFLSISQYLYVSTVTLAGSPT
jgi:hypothetical protein